MRTYFHFFLLVGVTAPAMAQGPSPVGLQQRAAVASPGERRDAKRALQQASVAPNQWKKGALIGGIAGAVLGAVLTIVVSEVGDGDADFPAFDALKAIGGSALLGALIGGMIGSFSHK